MKKTIFITLFLAAWIILLFEHSEAEYRYPTKSYVSIVKKGHRDHNEQGWYVTKRGYIAALDEELLDRVMYWAIYGDKMEFETFIASSPLVFPLKAGLRVRIEKISYPNKVRIRPRDSTISIWTVRAAIRLEFPMFVF